MTTIFKTITTGALLSVLTACSSVEPKPEAVVGSPSSLPEWITSPSVENGFADTQCVNNTADMNVLKLKATALARAEIAKQINIQVKAMDKAYASLTDTLEGSAYGGTFESVSKQVTNQKLAGSRPAKTDYVTFPDSSIKLCVMAVLAPENTEALYDELVNKSAKKLSPQHREVLYQEFKAYKAQNELEAEISKQ